ncbi:Selenoprotein N [Mizuhopecten yessoensis]|nr:Selenoprotein N [Mizuhopecten yessoensis]
MSEQDATTEPPEGGGDAPTPGDAGLRNRKGKQKTQASPTTQQETPESPDTQDVQQDNQPAPAQTPQQIILQAPQQGEEIIYVPSNRIVLAVPKWMLILVTIICGIIFVGLGGYMGDVIWKKYYGLNNGYGENAITAVKVSIGEEATELFLQFDLDKDGKLSIEEYEALYHRLAGSGFNVSAPPEFKQEIQDDDEVITVKAHFKPLLLETMTKDLDETFVGGGLDSLAGLKGWTKPNIEWTNLGVKHFKSFFPKKNITMSSLGEVYFIYENSPGNHGTNHMSSNRYYPPQLEESLVVIHRMLNMFHPRPFIRNRFSPQGAVACVRAFNDEYVDIAFRIHGEFQLNEPPFYPFWYTPGQFTGSLVMSRDRKKIVHFHMYVPTENKLNIDMEWLNGPLEGENMEVDIGFQPQMEVTITAPSVPLTSENLYQKDLEVPVDLSMEDKVKDIKWTGEITMTEARKNMEVKMYPFKQVEYFNFTNSFEKAKEERKLVHSILLWGALDDQSC